MVSCIVALRVLVTPLDAVTAQTQLLLQLNSNVGGVAPNSDSVRSGPYTHTCTPVKLGAVAASVQSLRPS